MFAEALMLAMQRDVPIVRVLYDCTTSAASADRIAAAGAERFRWFGQAHDPDSVSTGRIDVSKLASAVSAAWGPAPSGWGMLDFEVPFDDWLDLPPEDPRHRQALSELTRAIESMKRLFPGVKWTCYGIPRLGRWPRDVDGVVKGWSQVAPDVRVRELARRSRELASLVICLDWVSPSLYDVYENRLFDQDSAESMRANENLWRTDIVQMSKATLRENGRGSVPVIPCVSPLFQPGGKASVQAVIQPNEFRMDQLVPAINGGADGFAIWSAVDFAMSVSTRPASATLDKVSEEIRTSSRRAWRALLPGTTTEVDWESDDVRFRLSSALGAVVAGAVEIAGDTARSKRSDSGRQESPK
jgi:hypothetical protein